MPCVIFQGSGVDAMYRGCNKFNIVPVTGAGSLAQVLQAAKLCPSRGQRMGRSPRAGAGPCLGKGSITTPVILCALCSGFPSSAFPPVGKQPGERGLLPPAALDLPPQQQDALGIPWDRAFGKPVIRGK